MEITIIPIEDEFKRCPKFLWDERVLLFEVFQRDLMSMNLNLLYDNLSCTFIETLGSNHFQNRSISKDQFNPEIGTVSVECMDLRNTAAFGINHAVVRDSDRHNMLFMPEGFTHGFSAPEDAIFTYKCSNTYHKESEGGGAWDDHFIKIYWGIDSPPVSDKDALVPTLNKFVQDSEGGL